MSIENVHNSQGAIFLCDCEMHQRMRQLGARGRALSESLVAVAGRNQGLVDSVMQALEHNQGQRGELTAQLVSERPEGRRSL